MSTQTPLQQQYAALCGKHPGVIILIRLGDFYEAFQDQAKIVSHVCGVAITKRGGAPMAGIPAWAIDKCKQLLEEAGYKFLLAEYKDGGISPQDQESIKAMATLDERKFEPVPNYHTLPDGAERKIVDQPIPRVIAPGLEYSGKKQQAENYGGLADTDKAPVAESGFDVYCVGFFIGHFGTSVALIKKERPKWQAGKWNGIGGRVDSREFAFQAMTREFEEEAGLHIENWSEFATLLFATSTLHCFVHEAESGEPIGIRQCTDEYMSWVGVNIVRELQTVEGVRWLVPLALSRSPHIEIDRSKPHLIPRMTCASELVGVWVYNSIVAEIQGLKPVPFPQIETV